MCIKAVAPGDARVAEAPDRADTVGAVHLASLGWYPSPHCSHFQKVGSDFAQMWQPGDVGDEQTGGKNLVVHQVVAPSFTKLCTGSPSFLG